MEKYVCDYLRENSATYMIVMEFIDRQTIEEYIKINDGILYIL